HSVNDILVHSAVPLAFQDYIATGTLVPEVTAAIVTGVARGCRAHGMVLAGGETAQMPDVYAEGHYDLAGTIVGVVEEDDALHGDRVRPGDVLIGYASNGLHTNGYSLARRIVFDTMKLDLSDPFPDDGRPVAQVLLAVHVSYAAAVMPTLPRLHALVAVPLAAQEPKCNDVNAQVQAACNAAVDAYATFQPLAGIAISGGSPELGTARALGGLGHLFASIRVNAVKATVPNPDTT